MSEIDQHIGRRLRARRKEMRLTQTKLAEAVGISFQQCAKYETGANRLSAARLFGLCQVLDVAPNYFFAGLL